MIVFLDFEASSLGKDSYPIEVAWIFEDGRSRSMLIRPAEAWTDWSFEAERVHGLARRQLEAEGVPVDQVADEMIKALGGQELHASAPSWDGKWLSVLLRAAGHPRHLLLLKKSDVAFQLKARQILGPQFSDQVIFQLVEGVVLRTEPRAPVHRALADATLELERWRLVEEAARALRAH